MRARKLSRIFNKQVCLGFSVAFPTDINIRPEYHHEVPTRKCRSYTTSPHKRVHFYIPINILGTAMQNMVGRQWDGETAEKRRNYKTSGTNPMHTGIASRSLPLILVLDTLAMVFPSSGCAGSCMPCILVKAHHS